MPHVWFRCPDEANPLRDEQGRVEIDPCLDCSIKNWGRGCPWTYPILKLMVVEKERQYMSPTGLQKDPREWMLIHALDYAIDPEKAWARIRGTVMHANLEGDDEGKAELKLQRSIEIDGVTYVLRGQTDLIHTAGRTLFIRDWKTTDLSSQWRRDKLPKKDHIAQMSVYGWMAGKNEAGDGYDVAHGELVYIDMKVAHVRELVRLWSHARVEEYIRERLPVRHRMMQLGIQARSEGWTLEDIAKLELPPPLHKDDFILVDYMDVREQYLELMRLRNESIPTKED